MRKHTLRNVGSLACYSVFFSVNVAIAGHPAHRIFSFTTVSNVASGRSLWVAGDRPDIGNMTSTGGVRLYSAGGNQWVGSVAVRATTGSVFNFSFYSRDNASGQYCTIGNAYWGPNHSTNLALWKPGYSGKKIYYHSTWTNALIRYRVPGTTNFVDAVMTRTGAGRTGGEYRYEISGIGVAGEPIEFVMHGFSGGVEQWDNAPYGGYGLNNYYTPLDFFFLQDGNIYNYWPPSTVSAPSIVSVSFTSSYIANGIPSRGGRVYLPRGYTQNTSKRYPVLYMHDGQNVFDPGGAFGSWSADATATKEISQGRMRETIIVAVDNTSARMSEYGTPQDGYTGNYYLLFLIHNVKALIDANYRTLTDMMNTGNMGSSLGGLIAAYIGLATNKFGLIGAVSPSYWYGPNFRSWINTANTKGRRIYQDCGTAEGSSMWDYFWPVYGYYLADGYIYNDDIQIAVGCGQAHNEAAWANRLHNGFWFLYSLWDETNSLATNVTSAGTVQFASAAYSVSETGGSVRIYVSRTDGTNAAASVNYATANGTATAGSDYMAASGTLNWAAGDAAFKYFDVTILDDGSYEDNETFTAGLSGANGAGLGSPSLTTVTILDNESPPPPSPELAITNPPADIVVGHATTSYDVQGVANTSSWAGLMWSNNLTGAGGQALISPAWTIGGITLGIGTNVITVTATNVGRAVIAADSATNSAYDGGWTNGSNGGTGWDAWALTNWGANAGFFIATTHDANLSIGPRAWGLWATNNHTAEAARPLPKALAVNETLTLRFDNNWIQPGNSVGIGLQNASKVNLFEFMFIGGTTNYIINDSIMTRFTTIPWSGDGWSLTFKLTASNQYWFTAGTNLITGTLASAADLGITQFKAWNYSAGPGSNYNFYINDLMITGAGGPSLSTSATIRITRLPGESQIPQEWRDRHGLTGPNSGDDDDKDGDGRTNLQEYWADTDPNNAASCFGAIAIEYWSQLKEGLRLGLQLTPTTNSRLYDLFVSSNLVEGIWSPLGLEVPGADTGGGLTFAVTNTTDNRLFFKGRVRLQPP